MAESQELVIELLRAVPHGGVDSLIAHSEVYHLEHLVYT